jgi:hypothetical protein
MRAAIHGTFQVQGDRTMKTTRILQLFSLAALCLLLTSCFDSKTPLSDPEKSKGDERLAGVWRGEGEKGEVSYYHVGRVGDEFPESVMRVVGITHTKDGKIGAGDEFLIFPTTIGDKSYLNVTDGQDKHIKLVEEKGWTSETVSGYWILRYRVVDDVLTIQGIDDAAQKRAIESGKIKGEIKKGRFTEVFFTDTSENLVNFVAKAGDDLFSKDVLRLERVK